MRILLVEDDPKLAASLAEHVTAEGFALDCVQTYHAASEAIAANAYDCILLDIGLPDGNGLDLLHDIAQQDYDPGVIILTARGDIDDRLRGLYSGADDYLAKPFSLLELTARIYAVTRRKFKTNGNTLRVGAVELDLTAHTATVDSRDIELTKNEFTILRYLLLNKGKVVTRIALAEHVWGNKVDDMFSLDFLNSHIKNIRKKLADAGAEHCITTIYGVGYKCEEL